MPKLISFVVTVFLIYPCRNATAQGYQLDKIDLDNPELLYNMGINYLEGYGVPKNKQDAFSFILRAARLGHAEAQYRMGRSYSRAEFTDFDWNMPVYWYKKAAAQKHLQASLTLADLYGRGLAKPASSAEVITLYNNILDSIADSNIMLMYGNLYRSGKYGITENLDSARYWYTKALEQGNEYAQTLIDGLGEKQASARAIITDTSYMKPLPIDKRYLKAIIIGNYDYTEGRLSNPKNDVMAIKKKMKSLGIETKLYMNLCSDEFRDSVFQQIRESDNYDAIIFYYAGHAIQRNDINYMIPVDADMKMSTQTFLSNCLRVDEVTNMLNAHNDGCKIIILDACRDNMYLAKVSRGGKNGKGLSSTSLDASNSFIVFATQPGEIALDGITGSTYSPFAKALIEELDKPNLPIYKLFDNVKNRVRAYTDGEQTPVYMDNLKGSFVFNRQ